MHIINKANSLRWWCPKQFVRMFGDEVWYWCCQIGSAKCHLCVLSPFADLTGALTKSQYVITRPYISHQAATNFVFCIKTFLGLLCKRNLTLYLRWQENTGLSIIYTTWLVGDEMVLALFIAPHFLAYKGSSEGIIRWFSIQSVHRDHLWSLK